jgi:drug/metabolite transporter (DMT)-like permease
MNTEALILAIIPLIGWGLGDVFGIFSSRKIGSYLTTFYQFLFGIEISLLVLPFVWGDFSKITLPLLLGNLAIGTLYVLANFFVNEGFKQSSASVVGIIIQSFPAVVLVLSALIFKDPLATSQVFWVIIVFTGIFLCSVDLKELFSTKLKFDLGIKYALTASIIFSIYFTFFRLFSNQYGWFLPNFISFLTLPVALYFAKIIIKEKSKIKIIKNKLILGTLILSSLLIRSGDIALNLGLSKGYASIVSPLAGAAPLVFIIASSIVFKDKISKQQKLGIIVSLVGILGLSFIG